MRKKIIEYLKGGRIIEAIEATSALSLKRRVKYVYNDLIPVVGQLVRARRDFSMGLITSETHERLFMHASVLIMDVLRQLKKNAV